jgi:hypothetical protein
MLFPAGFLNDNGQAPFPCGFWLGKRLFLGFLDSIEKFVVTGFGNQDLFKAFFFHNFSSLMSYGMLTCPDYVKGRSVATGFYGLWFAYHLTDRGVLFAAEKCGHIQLLLIKLNRIAVLATLW